MPTKYILGLIVSTVILAGCTQAATPANDSAQPPAEGVMKASDTKSAEEKVGDTVVTGMISKVGEKFFITAAGQTPKEIDSYAIKLDEHVGKSVTITGQYSGDTLFVGKVQ